MTQVGKDFSEVLCEIKENFIKFKTSPPSIKFWNILVVIGVVISGFISVPVCIGLLVMSCFAAFILFIGNDLDGHYWVYITPLVIFILIICTMVFLFSFLHEKLIIPFNKFLDRKPNKTK